MSSNFPSGVSASDPHLTGEYPCSCDNGLDGEDTCPVCQGKGYVTGEESYLLDTYICDGCDQPSVVYTDTDNFECSRRCDPDAFWTVEQIAYGCLPVAKETP